MAKVVLAKALRRMAVLWCCVAVQNNQELASTVQMKLYLVQNNMELALKDYYIMVQNNKELAPTSGINLWYPGALHDGSKLGVTPLWIWVDDLITTSVDASKRQWTAGSNALEGYDGCCKAAFEGTEIQLAALCREDDCEQDSGCQAKVTSAIELYMDVLQNSKSCWWYISMRNDSEWFWDWYAWNGLRLSLRSPYCILGNEHSWCTRISMCSVGQLTWGKRENFWQASWSDWNISMKYWFGEGPNHQTHVLNWDVKPGTCQKGWVLPIWCIWTTGAQNWPDLETPRGDLRCNMANWDEFAMRNDGHDWLPCAWRS